MAVQTACVFFQQALKVAESAHFALDPDKYRRIHQGLASASVEVGDTGTALQQYGKAMEVCQEHGMVAHEMQILLEVGIARFYMAEEREESFKFYDQAIARAREVGDKAAESGILSYKGLYVGTLGHPYEGHNMVVEAEAIALQTGNPRAVATTRDTCRLPRDGLADPTKRSN